jgi:DNA-binding transcriptional MerR regulator
MAPQPAEDWRERFRQIHQQKGLVQAIQYLRDAGINQSEIRVFLEQEKAAGRIPRRPEQSSGNVV